MKSHLVMDVMTLKITIRVADTRIIIIINKTTIFWWNEWNKCIARSYAHQMELDANVFVNETKPKPTPDKKINNEKRSRRGGRWSRCRHDMKRNEWRITHRHEMLKWQNNHMPSCSTIYTFASFSSWHNSFIRSHTHADEYRIFQISIGCLVSFATVAYGTLNWSWKW